MENPVLVLDAPVAGTSRKSCLWHLLLPFLVAFAVRMVVVYFYYHQLPDADQNFEQFGWETGWIARSLASGHGFSSPFFPTSGATAFVPPLYPLLLSGIFRIFGIYSLVSAFLILTLNSLFSALTCIAIYWSAHHSLGSRGARIAAWVWAFYPFAIYFSAGRVWEYSLTTLLLTTCFCFAQRLHTSQRWLVWTGYGAFYGLAAYSNPAVLSCFPFLLAFSLWQLRKRGHRWFCKGSIATLALIAVLSPWVIRNYKALGIFSPMRDNFWLELYAGNCLPPTPVDRPSCPSPHPPSNPVEMRKYLSMGEIPYLQEKHVLAVQWLRQHPLDYARASLHRFVYYWTGYWSLNPAYLAIEPTELPMMFYVCGVTLLMLRGIWRFWKWNPEAGLPYFLLLIFFPAAYYLSLALIDHRMPIEPAIIVLAVAGAVPFRRASGAQWLGAMRTTSTLFK